MPATQAPFWQHPPLQAEWLAPQAASQSWVVRLQDVPVGQSAAPPQPQRSLTQAWPFASPVQSRQLPPLGPHAPGAVPLAQTVPVQQPPLHGEWLPSPQPFSHHWVVRLHDRAAGQSPAPAQPHRSPRQAWPPPSVGQS